MGKIVTRNLLYVLVIGLLLTNIALISSPLALAQKSDSKLGTQYKNNSLIVNSSKNGQKVPVTVPGRNGTDTYDFTFDLLAKPPPISKEDQNRSFTELEKIDPRNSQQNLSGTNVSGINLMPGPETNIVEDNSNLNGSQTPTIPVGYNFIRDGDFIAINRPVNTGSFSQGWFEPAVGNNYDGKIVFYSGNGFAARSEASGKSGSWSYIDPKEDGFPNTGDNDVIYSSKVNKFFWYRQGVDGRFSLGISSDARDWVFLQVWAKDNYEQFWKWGLISDLQKKTIAAQGSSLYPLNPWFDFPNMELSNDHLYISTNILLGCSNEKVTTSDPTVCDKNGVGNAPCGDSSKPVGCREGSKNIGSFIVRFSLDDLATVKRGEGIGYQYFADCCGLNYGLVQGAGRTMYWASHQGPLGSGKVKIYSWDTSGSFHVNDREIAPFKSGSYDCTIAGLPKTNWCLAGAPFITSGWIDAPRGKITFLWDAAQGCVSDTNDKQCAPDHRCPAGVNELCFQWPYVDAATFNVDQNFEYVGRPSIYNVNFAIQYAFASPAEYGGISRVAIMAWIGGGTPGYHFYPSLIVSLADGYEPYTSAHLVYSGTAVGLPFDPKDAGVRWGDYLRVRPYGDTRFPGLCWPCPGQGLWVASGYVYTTSINANMIYFIFGREGDMISGLHLEEPPGALNSAIHLVSKLQHR